MKVLIGTLLISSLLTINSNEIGIKTNELKLKTILESKNIIYYDTPQMYQIWNGPTRGVFRITNGTNLNTEIPWKKTAGIDHSPNCKVKRFVIFPQDDINFDGDELKIINKGKGNEIVWWRERLKFDSSDSKGSIIWQYPNGTVFGEFLSVVENQNENRDGDIFEIRTLTKNKNKWFPMIFRPFASMKEFKEMLATKNFKLEGSESSERRVANDRYNVFNETMNFSYLGAMDRNLTKELLTQTPFKSIRNNEWSKDCQAPTTLEDYHIIPKNYEGSFLTVDSQVCAKCHQTTLKHCLEFTNESTFHGRIRGSDGIFSFHIFDSNSERVPQFRKDLNLKEKIINLKI